MMGGGMKMVRETRRDLVARVSKFCLKTGEGATAGGARGIITEVT
jgi:hypothetical protein